MKLHLLLTAAFTAGAISTITASTDTTPRIYASVYSANEWKEYPSYSEVGLYSFGFDTPDRKLIKADPDIDAGAGGTMTEDFYFCTKEMTDYGFLEVSHYAFKPDTWELNSQIFGTLQGVATDLAYDHTTSKIYGCFSTDPDFGEPEGRYVFGYINEATGERQAISNIDTPWIALGCNRAGQLYSVSMDGTLMQIDKTKGTFTELAQFEFSANRRSTGTIDTATGIFYVVVTNEDSSTMDELGYSVSTSELYAIDIAALSAQKLYTFDDGEALGGMYIPGPFSPDGAPAAPTGFTLDFKDGNLNGTVSFTVPETTFDGSPLEGRVEYLIRANGLLFARSNTTAGTTINATGTIDEDGYYEFVLELSNEAGRAPKMRASQWVGHDTPVKITTASLNYADGQFKLEWNHPTATEHGGYMDASLLSYNVTRLPDNIIVAENTNLTSVADPVEIPQTMTAYSYRIDMSYRGVEVSSYTTDAYRLGSVALPYMLDFDNPDSFNDLTIIDVNDDNAEWYREEYWYIEALDLECTAAMYPYSSTNKADDWMILPALNLEKDVTYTVEFQVSTASDSYTESLAVSYGTSPTPEGLVNPILEVKDYAIYDPVDETLIFTPAATGQYYIGFHACSAPDGGGLALRNIKVDKSEQSGVSDIVSNDESNEVVGYYNLQGVKVDGNASGGIFIEVKADGTARKVMRK